MRSASATTNLKHTTVPHRLVPKTSDTAIARHCYANQEEAWLRKSGRLSRALAWSPHVASSGHTAAISEHCSRAGVVKAVAIRSTTSVDWKCLRSCPTSPLTLEDWRSRGNGGDIYQVFGGLTVALHQRRLPSTLACAWYLALSLPADWSAG